MIKTLFCTSTSDSFAPGTAVMIYSLRKNLSNFEDHTLKIFYTSISEKSKDLIRRAAGNINLEFVKPNLDHIPAGASTIYGNDNKDVYLCLESFNQPDYDTVICFDSDMLCISGFDYHLPYNKKCDFAAVYTEQVGHKAAYSTKGIENVFREPYQVSGEKWQKINAGFWIASGDWINGAMYEQMKKTVVEKTHKVQGADQQTVNLVYRKARSRNKVKFMRLPDGYNFKNWGGAYFNPAKGIGRGGENVFIKCLDYIKIIHYTGRRKPWATHVSDKKNKFDYCSVSSLKDLKESTPAKMWHQYYEECFGEKCIESIMISSEES
jgi:lipopolysaccharide biosynthesis glycosyltransferase